MNLFQEFEERKIDYGSIEKEHLVTDWNFNDPVDISIIIPVHGRTQFNHIVSDAFYKAWNKFNKRVGITIVEHSEKPEHEKLCRDWVNYIWIPQNSNRFNKCLCFNIGVLYSNKANYYLFHDVDILVPENFFNLLFENMKEYGAVQAFSGQRLFHCSHDLTMDILNGKFQTTDLKTDTYGVTPARAGAEGGSIFCKKELLLKTGLWPDWGFDQYSVEDSCMFRFLQLMGNVGFCNNPPINCYHMWHSPSFNRQTKDSDWQRYYAFMAMNEEGKKHLIKLQADHFNKYYAA